MLEMLKDLRRDLSRLRLRHSRGSRLLKLIGRSHGLEVLFTLSLIHILDRPGRRMIRLLQRHADYAHDLIRSFDYYYGAVEPYMARFDDLVVEVADFSTVRYHVVRGYDEHPICCPSLVEPFETCLQYLAFARLAPGQTVLDLGGYCGLTAIAFARAVGPSGRVVALEPDPLNRDAFCKNLAMACRAGLPEGLIKLLPMAVSSRSGTLTFSSEGAMGSTRMDLPGASIVGNSRGEPIQVEAISLDDLVRREGLDRIDFIKMDIEGCEIDVIGNAGDFLRRHRPRIILEPHIVDGVLCDALVSRQLQDFGYRVETIVQHGVALPLLAAVPY
jgi:FkbM family methyltransferase